MTTMTTWLAALGEPGLADLLARRGDALLAPQPRTLSELAGRLEHPASLAAALRQMPRPALQCSEALVALGPGSTGTQLAGFLDGGDDAVRRWLTVLAEHGVVWPGDGDGLCYPEALDELFADPFGLGPPLRVLVADVAVAGLRRILTTLGVRKPPTRRDEVVAEVGRVLGDGELVRGLLETAPRPVAEALRAWAESGGRGVDPYGDGVFDPAAARHRAATRDWAIERGLLFREQWTYGWLMPAEVARALRGPGYRVPFDPDEPPVPVTVLDADDVAARAADAVTRFAELTLSLVDRLAHTPVPALKSGGVGTREVAKLAKAFGCPELEVRLVLEVGAAIGVLACADRQWSLGPAAGPWREQDPAERIAPLLAAWWRLPRTPGEVRDADGKAVAALAGAPCAGCALARQNLLQTLAELGERAAAQPSALAERALWRRPLVHVLAQDEREPFATPLAEAAALGIVAGGALTPLGGAVLDGDGAALRRLLAEVLPAANGTALFGADLTAVVAGAPTAAVSRLLDSAADREGRGGATVWRFSAGSVRRALDAGAGADALAGELAAIASGELPQPLRYLIDDVGRRHGHLRVAAATSVVRGMDEALLAQVAADRALRKLGLRALAPTVLAADADCETVLAALRRAGYLPMPDGDAATTAPAGDPAADETDEDDEAFAGELRRWARQALGARSHRPAVPDEPVSAAQLAARLVSAPAEHVPPASRTEQQLAAARGLSPQEVRLLAYALDTASPVGIEYRSQSGGLTRRAISEPQLMGDSIVAWCRLRDAERWFRLDRIQAVFPVG